MLTLEMLEKMLLAAAVELEEKKQNAVRAGQRSR